MPGRPAAHQPTTQDIKVAPLGDFPSEHDAHPPLTVRSEPYLEARRAAAPSHSPGTIRFETVKPRYVAPAPEPNAALALDAWTESLTIRTRQVANKLLVACAAGAAIWMLLAAAASMWPVSIPGVRRPDAFAIGAPPRLATVNAVDAISTPRATSGAARATATANRAAPAAVPPATRRAPAAGRAAFTGALTVRSVPSGAVVLVDQQPIGRTPLSTRQLRAGAHAIWIEHDGYQRWSAAIHVPANAVTQVAATLNRSAQ